MYVVTTKQKSNHIKINNDTFSLGSFVFTHRLCDPFENLRMRNASINCWSIAIGISSTATYNTINSSQSVFISVKQWSSTISFTSAVKPITWRFARIVST